MNHKRGTQNMNMEIKSEEITTDVDIIDLSSKFLCIHLILFMFYTSYIV